MLEKFAQGGAEDKKRGKMKKKRGKVEYWVGRSGVMQKNGNKSEGREHIRALQHERRGVKIKGTISTSKKASGGEESTHVVLTHSRGKRGVWPWLEHRRGKGPKKKVTLGMKGRHPTRQKQGKKKLGDTSGRTCKGEGGVRNLTGGKENYADSSGPRGGG